MTRIERVLIIADPDPRSADVFDKMAALSLFPEARIVVAGFPGASDDPAAFGEALESTVRSVLGADVDIELAVNAQDNMSEWIVDRCQQNKFNLVVKVGHRTETLLHSPVDWQLVRECPAAVLLLSSDRPAKPVQIILATADIESGSSEQQALDNKILHLAADLASAGNARLEAAVCVKTSAVLSDLDLVDLHKKENAHIPVVREAINGKYADLGIEAASWHIHAGVPEKVLAGIARGIKADLVVMGSVGRKKLQGLLIGNTAEKILGLLATNVLIVKPD